MKLATDPEDDNPLWDTVLVTRTDFRPHWDGDLVNVATCIHPLVNRVETGNHAMAIVQEIASRLLESRGYSDSGFGVTFGDGDRFQIIVAWHTATRQTRRHLIKDGGDWEALAELAAGRSISFRRDWDRGIFVED